MTKGLEGLCNSFCLYSWYSFDLPHMPNAFLLLLRRIRDLNITIDIVYVKIIIKSESPIFT